MKTKEILTTGDVARHCHISYVTVANWIKMGSLKAHTTPGQHHRIHVDDFRAFLQKHGMPPYGEAFPPKYKVLVVDDDPDMVELIVNYLVRMDEYEVGSARDGFDAGVQVTTFWPDLVILDLMMDYLDGFSVCQRIKSNDKTKHMRILVITGHAEDGNIEKALACGADFCFEKPIQLEVLKRKIDALLRNEHRAHPSSLTG